MLADLFEQVVRREAGGDVVVGLLAAAERSALKLVHALETLIGRAGARAIYGRSITLTKRQHAWLSIVIDDPGKPARLAADTPQPDRVVMDAAVAVLVTFTDLLVSFIGEAITYQMLGQIWPEIAPRLSRPKESP